MSNLASLVYGYEFDSEEVIAKLKSSRERILGADCIYQIHKKYRPVALEEWTYVDKKTGEKSNPQIVGYEGGEQHLIVGATINTTRDFEKISHGLVLIDKEVKSDLEKLKQILAENDIPVPDPSVYLVLEKLHQTDSGNS